MSAGPVLIILVGLAATIYAIMNFDLEKISSGLSNIGTRYNDVFMLMLLTFGIVLSVGGVATMRKLKKGKVEMKRIAIEEQKKRMENGEITQQEYWDIKKAIEEIE